ncbi:MAG: hypothetical protein ACE361_15330 [Aureliella sp.]
MLDRESTFAQPELVQLLQSAFIPVAIDQAYQRRQKDTEGEFYRRIALQSPRNDFTNTTQGFYVASAGGELLLFNNNRDPEKVLRLVRKSLEEHDSLKKDGFAAINAETKDPRWNVEPPEGGLVIRVRAKVLGGYEPTTNRWRKIFQSSLSRDNLWITANEHQALMEGRFEPSLEQRIARFHLVDNTRGEPPMWRKDELKSVKLRIDDAGLISGSVNLATADGARGYQATLRGRLKHDGKQVTELELICSGEFWGHGRYTQNPPAGKFPLAIAFTIADGTDVADAVPPQGSRGWVDGYLR